MLRFGLTRNYSEVPAKSVFVSVIVAARNEADTILDCLISLAQLDYPENLIEIIIVNDRSEDATEAIIDQFIAEKACFKNITIAEPVSTLSGKASAISQAVEQSQGEIIFVTDADCIVPSDWIKQMSRYFAEDVGMVAGFTLLRDTVGWWHLIQNLDLAYLLGVAAGAARLGIPLTCMGNNFAFRRSAYQQIGGYRGVGFSVTEDFALLRSMSRKTDWKIRFLVDRNSLVKTRPVMNWREFLNQRKRWAVGGRNVHWFGKLLIMINLMSSAILVALIFLGENWGRFFGFSAFIFAGDYLLLAAVEKRLDSQLNLAMIPLYRLFFIAYSVILIFNLLLNRKVTWKGIEYR
ncbi:MAG: glycosyltransferase [candidate division KSB1 bacterium]|nr:glycosyltransferase [candidate division KSB1 bacterium]MDZ7335823.1 glycosyltransferase [candidate division KSB1 bacterium]MDZ7356182.1 glycosyltransferase [candidate division KSB1 bacterium]MDZ7400325.1 glycosyltransferase [candidate division KSB1 bacterium]